MLINGDSLVELSKLEDNSVDLIVTDPPYGYSFMGKEWDKALPDKRIWKECVRVLKHGGFAYVMSAPRQDVLSRMMINLEDSGFNIGFTSMYWAYATGFPKAMNMSKAVDKRAGRNDVSVEKLKLRLIELFNISGKTRNAIDLECGFRASNYLTLGKKGKKFDPWIDILPSTKKWEKIKTVLGCDDDIKNELDSFFQEAVREITSSKIKINTYSDIGYSSGEGDYKKTEVFETKPSSIQAKKMDGSYAGFQPKPAVEVIIVCMKPLEEKGYITQALKNGKGVSWFDDCRIPFENDDDKKTAESLGKSFGGKSFDTGRYNFNVDNSFVRDKNWKPDKGRYPANLLVSDNAVDTGHMNQKSGRPNIVGKKYEFKHNVYEDREYKTYNQNYSDGGDFSRYFDIDKWWEAQFIITPKASKSEKNKGLDDFEEIIRNDRGNNQSTRVCVDCGKTDNGINKHLDCNGIFDYKLCSPIKNNHPTVKPLKLMSYLITLGSREGDVVLDPFMGSGTTPLASKQLNRKYIGIELDEDYFKICKARVEDC